MPPEPRWYPLRTSFTDSGEPSGHILCAFTLVENDFKFRQEPKDFDLDSFIPRQDMNIKINVLGLRNLCSFGILPVQKAFIRFNQHSIMPPNIRLNNKTLATEPNATGDSPSIS